MPKMNETSSSVPYASMENRDGDLEDVASDRRQQVLAGESTSTNNDASLLLDMSYKASFKWIQLSFFLLGLATLLPWSFLITADDYWKYKFRDVNASHSGVPSSNRTELQVFFQSYLSMANNVPFVVVLVLNAFLGHKVSQWLRNEGSLIFMLVIFVLTTTMVEINTDAWQEGFFWLTMWTVVALSSVAAFFQGSLMGIVSIFPASCLTPVVSGQATAGVLATLASILSLAGHVSSEMSALLYFLFADLMLVAAMFAYLFLKSTHFYKYHFSLHQSTIENVNSSAAAESLGAGHSVASQVASSLQLLRHIWPHCISIFLTFFISLSVFPPLCTLILPDDDESAANGWTGRYFVPLTCFLLYNAGDLSGRTLSGFVPLSVRRRVPLFVLALLRLLLIPAIMGCNLHKSGTLPRHFPILFHSEVVFIFLMTFLGLSNGYIFGTAMLNGPKSVPSEMRERAGFVLTAFLGSGLAGGALFSNFLLRIL